MPIDRLTGTKAPAPADRTASTPGADLTFAHNTGAGAFDSVPALIANKREFSDPNPKDISLSSAELSNIKTLDDLEKAVNDLFEKNKDYLEATEITGTNNEQLGVAGLRKPRFFEGLSKKLDETGLPASEQRAGNALLRRLEAKSFMNRDIEFTTGKMDTYHPYRTPFDKGVRKLMDLESSDEAKSSIENLLNYVTDRKTTKSGSSIEERDLEKTIGLRPVDRENGEQTLSLAKDATNPLSPSYVVINVKANGLPDALSEHAGKAVFRDGDKVYFDKSATEVPAELLTHIEEKPASDKTGLRLLEDGEKVRSDFPYDWNKSGHINVDTINTGWWGHCHLEAPLAAMKLDAASNVTIFDAQSKKEHTFGATDVNDLMFALFDAGEYRHINNGGYRNADNTAFVGNRNDTTGAPMPGENLVFKTDSGNQEFDVAISRVYDSADPDKVLDLDDAFSPTRLKDDGLSFEANPLYMGKPSGKRDPKDWSQIDGKRKIDARVEYLDVDASGNLTRSRADITIDPANPADEPILLGSQQAGGGYPPKIKKFYLNQSEGRIESRVFEPVKKDDGTYEMKAVGDANKAEGKVQDLKLNKELTKESVVAFHNHMLEATRSGVSYVTEKSSGHAVWNYATDGLRIDEVESKGDYAKYEVTANTQGGTKSWSYILRYDDDGKPVDAHAIGAPPDFLYENQRWVSAPIYKNPDSGEVLYNSSAFSRGYLTNSDGKVTDESLAFFRSAADVVYASLQDPT
ncbi:MAG: hypothetical protein QGI45_03515, partial [Myxococcota bacterium]|nr:hypothetical protein [Myxococcota bacterium]